MTITVGNITRGVLVEHADKEAFVQDYVNLVLGKSIEVPGRGALDAQDLNEESKKLWAFAKDMQNAKDAAQQARIIWRLEDKNIQARIRKAINDPSNLNVEDVERELKKLESAPIKTAGASDHLGVRPMNVEDIQKIMLIW